MAMDPVNHKALKKDFKDRADKDIDNDGDTDSTDKYLHARRKAVSKAIGKMKESVAVFESHFQVGQKVEYEAPDGGEYYGTIIKTDKPEEGAYYHVKLENGKVVKAKPEQLEAEDDDEDEEKDDDDMKEEVELDEATFSMDIDYNYEKRLEAGAKKAGLGVKFVQHGGATEMVLTGDKDKITKFLKARRVPASEISSGFIKEEAKLDEVLDTPERMDSYRNKAKASKERAAKSAVATVLRSKDKETRAHPAKDLKTIAKRTAGEKMADRNAARKFRKMNKEEVELDEDVRKMTHGRLKFHMNNKHIPHGSYSFDQMKAERDRRLKTGQGEAYKKAKMSMSEEVELDEISRVDYKKHGATFAKLRKQAQAKVDKEIASKNKSTKKEEVEQIDEISKKTLARYVDRAANDATIKAYKAGDVRDKDSTKNYMKSLQRQLGIKKALKKLAKEELSVSDGMGAWIDDFKKSDAPQFKGKDDKERREMAVAAYLAAKRKNK